MRGRLLFVAGVATGFVLGARAGRGAYVTIKSRWQEAASSPQVRGALDKARELAEQKAPRLASVVTGGGSSAAGSAPGASAPTQPPAVTDALTPTPEQPDPSASAASATAPTGAGRADGDATPTEVADAAATSSEPTGTA